MLHDYDRIDTETHIYIYIYISIETSVEKTLRNQTDDVID